jgi:hypothetical protein
VPGVTVQSLRKVAASTRLNADTLRRLAEEVQPAPEHLRQIAIDLDEQADAIDKEADQAAPGGAIAP